MNGLYLKKSNITCTFSTTEFPRNRSSFFKPVDSVSKSSDAPEDIEHENEEICDNNIEAVHLSERNKKFKEVDTIHKKYSERPSALHDICLAQFGSSFQSINSVPEDIEWNENASSKEGIMTKFSKPDLMPKFIKLSSGGYMVQRIRPVILRIHSSTKKEPHEGIYSELLLFYPWKNEKELYENDPKLCEKLFNENEETISLNKRTIYPNSTRVDTIKELLECNDIVKPTHLSEALNLSESNIDPNAQQENMEDQETLDSVNPLDTSKLPIEGSINNSGEKPDGCPYKSIKISSRDEMYQSARKLSFSQRILFDKVVTYCKSIVMAKRGGNPSSMEDPPLLIFHGKM